MTKKACAYIRVSDERQDEYSPDSQRKRIQMYAQQHNLLLLPEDIFYDDGISARKAENRTAFQQMIARAKHPSHPFDVILVWKFSRFARNQEESIVYKNLLRKNGIEVISVSEPIADDPFGALIERIIEWMDEYYLVNLSSEVRRGMAEKAGRGEAMGQAVFGYDRSNKSYVPNGDAPRVEKLFRDFCSGASPAALANELAAEGVRTSRGNAPTGRWVRYLLKNPVYIGQVRWQGAAEQPIMVERAHPAIVSEQLFRKTQEKINWESGVFYQKSVPSARWIFCGRVFCAACGAPLVRAGANPPTLQCGRYVRGKCSVSHSISCRKLQKALMEGLNMVLREIDIPVQLSSSREHWVKRQAAAENRLRRAAEAYRMGVDTLDEYSKLKKQLTDELRQCQMQMKRVEHIGQCGPYSLVDFLQNEAIPVRTRTQLFDRIVRRVIYDKTNQMLTIELEQENSP